MGSRWRVMRFPKRSAEYWKVLIKGKRFTLVQSGQHFVGRWRAALCASFAKRVAPLWEYPPNTAFVRCLYLCFYELLEESEHATLCQNIGTVMLVWTGLNGVSVRLMRWGLNTGHITVNMGSKFWEYDEWPLNRGLLYWGSQSNETL